MIELDGSPGRPARSDNLANDFGATPRRTRRSRMVGWIFLGLLVLLAVWLIFTYNGLVSLRQRCRQSFSDIDVQLKQRHDLIPNLVATVQGYAAHERGTLEIG